MEQPLSQREFDLWREADNDFKQQVLTHVQGQIALNLQSEGRMKAIEIRQDSSERRATLVATGFSTVMAALAALFGTLFARGH
jgi:hypothetical protein